MINKLSALTLFSLALSTQAGEFHHENFPVGDMPSAFAGAYTAHTGSTFSMHYNPAGIHGIEKQLSGTLNAFSSNNATYEEVFPTPVGIQFGADGLENIFRFDSLERSSNTMIPGFLGYVQTFNNISVGGYLSTPDISYEQLADNQFFNFNGTIEIYPDDDSGPINELGNVFYQRSLSLDSEYNVTQAGLSASLKPIKTLSIGTTLGFILAKKKEIYLTGDHIIENSDTSDYQYNDYLTESTRINDEYTLIEPKIGLLWVQDGINIGANISKKISLARTLSYNATYLNAFSETSTDHFFDPSTDPINHDITTVQIDSKDKQDYPVAIDIGVLKHYNWGSISFDIHHYGEAKGNKLVSTTPNTLQADVIYLNSTRDFEQTTNYAIAFNYLLNANTSVYLGAYTDYSNTKLNLFEDSDDFIFYRAHEDIDLFGISLAVNHKTEDFNATLGIIAASGSGQAASWELIAFGGGNDEGFNDYFEVEKNNFNVFFGIQY